VTSSILITFHKPSPNTIHLSLGLPYMIFFGGCTIQPIAVAIIVSLTNHTEAHLRCSGLEGVSEPH
jgi:hypothetical protein